MNLRSLIVGSFIACTCTAAVADTISVTSMRHAGPFALMVPYQVDSVNVSGSPYAPESLLQTPISFKLVDDASAFEGVSIGSTAGPALHLLSFTLDNSRFAKADIKVEGLKKYEMYLDGAKTSGKDLQLKPATRQVVIKCLTDTAAADTLKVLIDTKTPELFTLNPSGRRFTTRDMYEGLFAGSVALSPSGKYLVTGFYHTEPDGKNAGWSYEVSDVATGKLLSVHNSYLRWMPKTDRLYYTRKRAAKQELVTVDPVSGIEEVVATDLPDRRFTISPTEDFLIFSHTNDGPKEKNTGLYQILNPEDRQSGWRDRDDIMKHDLATGISTPLTFGYRGAYASNLSDDGTKLLFSVSERVFGNRPTGVTSYYLLDIPTMQATCLVDKDGFVGSALLSPDGKTVAVKGSPESFGGIGKNLPEGMTPNLIENELFLLDIATGKVTPVTRDFDPSVDKMSWSRADGNLYFVAEDRDYMPLYRLNPSTGKIDALNAGEDYISNFSLAVSTPVIAYYGQGPDHASRVYTMDTKKLKPMLRADVNTVRQAGLNLDETHDWSFVSTTFGDTIYARYNLPTDFDPSKKYPVIVYYYGGCSPVNRTYSSTYNPHLWASHGYIGLVINPSGATGRGQEFASRHVATAGQGVAQDIIDGVKAFLAEHPYADASKVGCHGASYGGFMTQYLQTQTDIFAAAISHAGISDHTSYWGNGYWGYSYSEASMGDKRPWSDPELYVSQSPLYNADKVTTPLLFLHGDSDNNVPFGESVQMFTALKLLGKETAFVAVKGQDHHILDFDKREKWLNTMMAWFAKYLQDDPSWWDTLYPETKL